MLYVVAIKSSKQRVEHKTTLILLERPVDSSTPWGFTGKVSMNLSSNFLPLSNFVLYDLRLTLLGKMGFVDKTRQYMDNVRHIYADLERKSGKKDIIFQRKSSHYYFVKVV